MFGAKPELKISLFEDFRSSLSLVNFGKIFSYTIVNAKQEFMIV